MVIEVFSEVIVAPDYDAEALEVFASKKNLRVLKQQATKDDRLSTTEYKQISGGMLIQDADNYRVSENDLRVVSKRQPTPDEIRGMLR